MSNKIQMIKRLREETGLGLVEAKKAVEAANMDYDKAMTLLMARGVTRIKPNRATNQGRIEVYSHNGRIGAMVEVSCETDFVARTDRFKELSREIAMQIASMNAESVDDLLAQDYIRDPSKKVADLVHNCAVQCGENIKINRFTRFGLTET